MWYYMGNLKEDKANKKEFNFYFLIFLKKKLSLPNSTDYSTFWVKKLLYFCIFIYLFIFKYFVL